MLSIKSGDSIISEVSHRAKIRKANPPEIEGESMEHAFICVFLTWVKDSRDEAGDDMAAAGNEVLTGKRELL